MQAPSHERKPRKHRPRKKRQRVKRFIKAYLMLVGALTTGYVLVQLIVRLLIEIGRMK